MVWASFWGSMLGTQHLEDAVIKAAQKQGMSVLLCSDGKRQAEAVHSVCGSGWSYCLRALFAKKMHNNMHQHATFFFFNSCVCWKLKPIFENLWPQIEGWPHLVCLCRLWPQTLPSVVAVLVKRFVKSCSRQEVDDVDGTSELLGSVSIHLGRWTMCPLIGSCQRLAWWFVMVVLGQPFVPLEQVPLRLKFIHLALSAKRVEFSFHWHTRIWELSSYPRCTPRGHTRYPEMMIINNKA